MPKPPDYSIQENIENLVVTIKSILVHHAERFKTKNLKNVFGFPVYFFPPHLKYLVEKGHLSRERSGGRKNITYRYTVKDWKKLEDYYQEIIGRLPSEFVERLLSEKEKFR